MPLIAQTLAQITLGPPSRFQNLTLVPLLDAGANEPHYLTLGDALAAGAIDITEISEAGSVPSLKAVNRADRAVLILDGEELVGAKQNRIVNVSILVPAGATITLPVSCVEQGRWSIRYVRRFAASKQTMHAQGRRRNVRMVHGSLMHEGSYRGDQQAVWREVDDKARRMNVDSATGALGDVYDRYDASLDEYAKAFHPLRGERGAVFAVNGRVEGLELVDNPATWSRVQPKLSRSYALDAIDRRRAKERDAQPTASVVEGFIAAISAAPLQRFPGIGAGETIRFQTAEVVGAGLVVGGREGGQADRRTGGPVPEVLVHLTAFTTVE
jgi:hypothetical protein